MMQHRYAKPLFRYVFIACGLTLFATSSLSAQSNADGWMYGAVTTWDGDTYEGQIRWGKEEAFWTDMFNASKQDNEYIEYLDRDVKNSIAGRRNNSWNNGWGNWVSRNVSYHGYNFTHQFSVQFGDIQSIERKSKSKVYVTLRDGEQVQLDGSGYNDVGTKVRVYDAEVGKIELDWGDVEHVAFKPAPANYKSAIGEPLYGRVKSWTGDYEGYIIWDKDERVTTDKLDGETRDADMSIEFGNIASIQQKGNSSQVTLKSGRSYRMGDSNDVDNGNRGVVVVMPGQYRVVVDWDDFDEVTFTEPSTVKMANYASFAQSNKINGTVTTRDGKTYTGNIVYDLDEAYDYEILNGKIKDTEFEIPFRNIKRIQPRGDESLVELRNGQKYELDDSQDVDDHNTGLLVFDKGNDDPIYIFWEDVEEVVFK